MKKINFKTKLNLNKEVISRLNEMQMDNAKGGNLPTHGLCGNKEITDVSCATGRICQLNTVDTYCGNLPTLGG